MASKVLMVITAVIPLVAVAIEWFASEDLSERHHSHHDTFVITSSLKRSLVIAMIFMGVTGVVLGWLCEVDVFEASPSVVMGFFAGFIIVSFLVWALMRRYRVALYEDHMVVLPFFGASKIVRYSDISSMEWTGMRSGSGYRNLAVFVGGERVATLWGGSDLEQILMRIDRFDVLGHSSIS